MTVCCGEQLLTQVCVALSAMVLRADEWRKPVDQLFASLNELQGQGTGSNAVLELLTVLPEEVIEDQSVLSSVDSGRRWQFTQEVRIVLQEFDVTVIVIYQLFGQVYVSISVV